MLATGLSLHHTAVQSGFHQQIKDQDYGVFSCVLCFCRSGFPGAQPVSMDLQNITFLERNPYKVSWKADGTRWVYCPFMSIHGVSLFLCQTISQRG